MHPSSPHRYSRLGPCDCPRLSSTAKRTTTAMCTGFDALSLAPTSAACHAHTHHVRQRPRTSTQPTPPPYTSASSRAYLSRMREATTSFPAELGGLGTGGDAIHPRRARNLRSTALAPVSLASLRRVHFAYAVSITGLGLGGPSEPRNGNKTTAECTRARTFGKASGSTAPRPFINDTLRTRGGLVSGRYEPLTTGTRVPPVLSPRHVASLSPLPPSAPSPPSLHHVISIHVSISPHVASPPTRLGSSNPSPPSNDASPTAPSAGPRAFAFGARKLQYVSEAVHARAKYARCVQRAGRIRHAHHVPPTSTAAFSPTSRAGLSPSCDPSPRHAQATAHQAKTLRKHRIAWMGIE
ncbi:hypothetical protein B0H14DRAFT_3867155 [Mycena olivaceomarginata]|nr:hypothetical protein B0H14DRAFT_3867155 [Mycena olivaceomarginata]